MNKTLCVLLLLLLLLFCTFPCQGAVVVEPAELTIMINDGFIQKNSPANITILNDNNYTINVTWYLEHPNPSSLLRPNRTFIENFSWIQVTPSWQLVAPYASASFSIVLSIPKRNDLFDQHWETWVTFTPHSEHGDGIFQQEYAVRVYIDTPASSDQPSIPDSNTQDYTFFILLVLLAALIIGSIVVFYWVRKKKSP